LDTDVAWVDVERARAEGYRELFDNSPIGIINVGLDGTPLLVNQRAATTFGYASPEEFLSAVPSMPRLWVYPEERDRAAEILLSTGVLRDFEVAMRRRDGQPITLSLSANPWRDRSGTVIGLQISGIDITERLQAQHMVTEFVGIVAHDLRVPLAVAAGYSEFLVDQWDDLDDAAKKQFIERIQRSLERIEGLVADVSDVTRLESGTVTFDAAPFDLRELVRSAVEDAASVDPHPTITVHAADPLPAALGNRENIARVLSNLLSNAVKYAPGAAIDVGVRAVDGMLRVSVRDRGPGISPDDVAKLFQKFSRLPSTAGDGPPGSGLGLFICRSLVEAGGGRIWVDSFPGEGSEFSFTAPAAIEG
jgi:PAS domain S-box-containing protein